MSSECGKYERQALEEAGRCQDGGLTDYGCEFVAAGRNIDCVLKTCMEEGMTPEAITVELRTICYDIQDSGIQSLWMAAAEDMEKAH